MANFAAGAFLIILKPFKVGDFICAGGVAGTVREVGCRDPRIQPSWPGASSATHCNNAHYWQVYFDTIRETFGDAHYPVPEQHLMIRQS